VFPIEERRQAPVLKQYSLQRDTSDGRNAHIDDGECGLPEPESNRTAFHPNGRTIESLAEPATTAFLAGSRRNIFFQEQRTD
jgi:hypothetical protein